MIGFLRCLGVLNAGLWFGAAIFFTLGIGPAVFSDPMKQLLENFFPYYSGAIAQILIARYFKLHLICGIVALGHLAADNMYFGRKPQQWWFAMLAGLMALSLLGGFWLQPKLKELHTIKYSPKSTPNQRQEAAASFKTWHGVSMMMNLLMMVGMGVHLCRVSAHREEVRFVGSSKFRG